MNKVITVKEIQEILGICENTAYKLIRQALKNDNMFRVIKIGKLYKIPRDPFLNWLDGLEY